MYWRPYQTARSSHVPISTTCGSLPPSMATSVFSLPTFDDLRQHVLETLCKHDLLDPQQTPFFQGLVTRAGRPCGLFFEVQGPRSLRTYALWSGNENRILFYDGQGERIAETRLSEAPDSSMLNGALQPRKLAA
jgi:hypothetical protein